MVLAGPGHTNSYPSSLASFWPQLMIGVVFVCFSVLGFMFDAFYKTQVLCEKLLYECFVKTKEYIFAFGRLC
jgi:hypothetical protein